ncbi:hypothetical protein [Vannielia litorea]|uniref:hypothetical protein n=1 Tax=Vannielia litorea TaxID=1217970 RepID=UPI001C963146|nr:hypothetical protein [Vannielia litorea]MBY6046700.1 hypothetical protein [Vannielia litorea]MBY6074114.1 hypothetical protein [Vannielia litorea]
MAETREFTLSLHLLHDLDRAEWLTNKFIVTSTNRRWQTLFEQPIPLTSAFAREFVDHLEPILQRHHDRTFVETLDDIICITGLVIAELRLVPLGSFSRTTALELKVGKVFGCPELMLHARHRLSTRSSSSLDHTPVAMLIETLAPCIAALSPLEDVNRGAAERSNAWQILSELRLSRAQLEACLELLARSQYGELGSCCEAPKK